jgi:hypothetical protein
MRLIGKLVSLLNNPKEENRAIEKRIQETLS